MRLWLRIGIAVLSTLVFSAAAVAYPYLAKGETWAYAQWQYKWFALGLVVLPAVFWWGTFGQDRRRPRLRIGTVVPLASGPRGARAYLRDVPGVLRTVALAMLIAAMCRPVSVLQDEKTDEQGIDIVVVMDLSGSMRAVLDADASELPGSPHLKRGKRLTRLDTAKLVIRDFIGRRKTDRIGVVVFGKAAYVLSPPTLDYHLLSQMVGKMNLNVIDGGATAIGDAVTTAVARLRKSDAQSKVIILLTDGDSNAGKVSPDYATKLANRVGCKVYTIQIGAGDEVEVETGHDIFGNPQYSRQRFPVNPELLERIATQTGGNAYVATDAKALANSMHDVLDQLEKTRFEASIRAYEDLFPLLLIPGVALLALDALLRAWLLRRFP
jgi:Ca-activated chloride channel family protein